MHHSFPLSFPFTLSFQRPSATKGQASKEHIKPPACALSNIIFHAQTPWLQPKEVIFLKGHFVPASCSGAAVSKFEIKYGNNHHIYRHWCSEFTDRCKLPMPCREVRRRSRVIMPCHGVAICVRSDVIRIDRSRMRSIKIKSRQRDHPLSATLIAHTVPFGSYELTPQTPCKVA